MTAESIIAEFRSGTMPRERFNHQAHLCVGLYHLSHPWLDDEAAAAQRVRDAILAFNDRVGAVQTESSGYHETITLFYVRIIRHFLSARLPSEEFNTLADALLEQWGDPKLPLRYWTKERLMSWESRLAWVEPDLQSLPSS
jgi:hypothetical protein